MFAHRFFAARHFAPRYYPPVAAAAPVATGNKGRRLVRWVISAPSVENPVGEWIRQRDDDEILFL